MSVPYNFTNPMAKPPTPGGPVAGPPNMGGAGNALAFLAGSVATQYYLDGVLRPVVPLTAVAGGVAATFAVVAFAPAFLLAPGGMVGMMAVMAAGPLVGMRYLAGESWRNALLITVGGGVAQYAYQNFSPKNY